MASFIQNAEKYVELHKNLIENAKATKNFRKEKSALGKELLEYMMQHQIADHVFDGFELVNKEREVKNKLSIEMIENMLENFVNESLSQDKIDSIVNAIVESELSGDTKNALVVRKTKEPKARSKKSKTDTTEDA
jgi:nucleoside diphosphate kinase